MKHLMFFFSVAALLFLSACKSAHSVCKEVESAQQIETSQSSAVTATALTDFISAISLQADSIVMWVQPDLPSRTPVLQDLSDSTQFDKSDNSGLTSPKSNRKANSPHNAIKVYGLHLNSSTAGESKCSLQTEDSASSTEKRDFTCEEKEKSKPPACAYASYFIYGAIATAVAIAIALIRRKMKK